MAIYTDKRNGRLYVQFEYRKELFKQSLPPGATRKQAHKLEIKMRNDAFFQANGMQPKGEVFFEDAVQEYLAHIQHNKAKYNKAEYVLIAAKPFLKNKVLRSIAPVDIERFMIFRQESPSKHDRPRKPATIWREIAVLSAFFTFCRKKCKYIEVNPCEDVEKPGFSNIQTKVLAREYDKLFFAGFDVEQGPTARDVCLLVLNTGLSQNDALGLTDFHVNITNQSLQFTRGKTKRFAEIPVNDTAWSVIAPRLGKGLLFPSTHRDTRGKQMLSIRTAIAGACRRAEIPPITIRDLRRTFATRLAEEGVDALTIARLLMHSDLRMVHRYAHASEVMRDAVNRLDNSGMSSPSLIRQKLKAVK